MLALSQAFDRWIPDFCERVYISGWRSAKYDASFCGKDSRGLLNLGLGESEKVVF